MSKELDIACPNCGAYADERCSDVGVFVRDTAFHCERQKEGEKMTCKVPVDQEHLDWLMEQIEARCKDKTTAVL